MIQIFDVLGKDYDSIKGSIIRTDFTSEDLELLSKIGGLPPITEASFNDDLYFFNFKINKYKIDFFNDKIVRLGFIESKERILEILEFLMNLNNFRFQFFTKKQIEKTEWKSLDNNINENNFVDFKTKRF